MQLPAYAHNVKKIMVLSFIRCLDDCVLRAPVSFVDRIQSPRSTKKKICKINFLLCAHSTVIYIKNIRI
nr:MAG TPA: hypothetical protein [Caudoviricetes sp.]